ncbi:MAG: hypothetical protein JWN24_4944 [Phycisphaerales bacterium]|nr:hypothetical protein [Phycisphaerales bacterium]
MLRLLVIPVALLALLAGMMFWSGSAVQQKADFTFISRDEVRTLDPNRMSWTQDFRIAYGLSEGLYRLDPRTLQAIPGNAGQIDISPDKSVYTFHIRPEARWSNGDPVQAGDFVFAWRRMLEEPGEYTYLLHYIKGAKQYEDAFGEESKDYRFKEADFSKVGVEALDERTLKVTLIHPVVPFPDFCTMPPFFPLNEKAMEKYLDHELFKKSGGRVRRYDKEFFQAPHLVTNGPYKLESWTYKRRMRMVVNPFYWNKGVIQSAIVDQVVAEDEQWAFAMYDSGGADWVTDFSGDIAAELYAKHRSDVHVFPAFGTYFYSFNCQPKLNDGSANPFVDKRVRQALSMALEKRVITQTITRMGEIPTTTYIPANSFQGYKTPKGLPYDVPAAKKLLAEAGYPDGKGFPNVALLFNNASVHGPIAENIRRQWLDNLGIDVKLEGIEVKTFGDRQRNKDYAVCRASWFGDYLDPSTFTDKYKPDSENNEAGWKNPEYSDWCKKGDEEPDPQKRLDYYARAEEIMLEEAPILPIYTYVECFLFHDKVYGIPLNPRTMHVMSSVGVHR